MKTSLILLVCFLLLIRVVYSSSIDVGVSEVLDGNVISVDYDNSSNVVEISEEFYNTGSVPYKARIKTEIFSNSELIFSGWGQENDFMPGDKKTSYIHWYASSPGEYSAKLKVYFADSIKEYKKFDFSVDSVTDSEDIFNISNFRTYDNYVLFDLKSSKDANNITIIPVKYTAGWIFEQKEIASMAENSSKYVMLNYYPSLWEPSSIELTIVADDGKYYTEKTLEMKKIGGITGLFYYIIDGIRLALFK